MEDTGALKLSLTHDNVRVWCDEIAVPELKTSRNEESDGDDDDHTVVVLDQKSANGSAVVTVYFGCAPKGRIAMPQSLKQIHSKARHSKVKLFHGEDLELQVKLEIFL